MKKKVKIEKIKSILPYVLYSILVILFVFLGTISKRDSNTTLSIDAFSIKESTISADQVSEMYIVANISNALNLASSDTAAENFVMTKTLYKVGQSTNGKLEKTPILEAPYTRGVIIYTVKEGDSIYSIAQKNKLTKEQIRWSNGLLSSRLYAGMTLFLPGVPGIVYTVKSGDTLSSIATKCGSTVEEIKVMNDLETTTVDPGLRIVIKGGTLPREERPEYTRTAYATTRGLAADRITYDVLMTGFGAWGGYAWGNCTSWAWYNRQDLPFALGDANYWAEGARLQGFPVDYGENPQIGDVFQYRNGTTGHVGIVEDVFEDGSLLISEANYRNYTGVVSESLVSRGTASQFTFIHRKY